MRQVSGWREGRHMRGTSFLQDKREGGPRQGLAGWHGGAPPSRRGRRSTWRAQYACSMAVAARALVAVPGHLRCRRTRPPGRPPGT